MNVGEVLASELKELTGIEAVASDLTYDLRSGEPDMLDSMVATTFANVAMDLIRDGIGGPDGRGPRRQVRPRVARRDRRSRRGASSSTRTTRSASGPSTRTGWATRCC